MQFQTQQIRDFQSLLQQITHILQMRLSAIGPDVGLTAMDDIAMKGEIVIQTAFFRRCLLHKLRQQSKEVPELIRVWLEVRMDTNNVLMKSHGLFMNQAAPWARARSLEFCLALDLAPFGCCGVLPEQRVAHSLGGQSAICTR